MRERTFALIKPDGVQRGLTGRILSRFEDRGLKIVAAKMLTIPRSLAEEYYAEHEGKPFYAGLVDYVTSGPVLAMVIEGDGAVEVVRRMMGATDPSEASTGTIRGDFGLQIGRNLIHGSDSKASAEREIGLFFSDGDLQDYRRIDEAWLYE
jgi:nucleoside-diphosphate kinase